MPLMRCRAEGKLGMKYGPTGKCYTGLNAKQKAMEQARAIRASRRNNR